jgi:hypothetical protein
MKRSVPWPIKFGAKLLLGAARLDYRVLKRTHIVEHGKMEDAEFSARVFNRHVVAPLLARGLVAEGALVELGPGDSVASGLLGRAFGFSRVALVDTSAYADLRPCVVNRLNIELNTALPMVVPDASTSEVLEYLSDLGIEYLTGGLRALRELAPGSVRHAFSNSVLQHVYLGELTETIRALGEVHAVDSLCSHLIKFTDHFSGGFLNHRFPEWFMESGWVKRAHLYTNRVSATEFLELFESAGFELDTVAVDYCGSKADEHVEYRSPAKFRAAASSRQAVRAVFVLRRGSWRANDAVKPAEA